MIIRSLNIKRGGSRYKRRIIGVKIVAGKAYIFLVQETKLNFIDSEVVSSFWSHQKVGGPIQNQRVN